MSWMLRSGLLKVTLLDQTSYAREQAFGLASGVASEADL